MSNLILIKKGDLKSGFFSKRIAAEIKFNDDKIVASPMGWNRIFNNFDTIIFACDSIRIRFTWRVIGYNISMETMYKNYTISLMGDKLEVTRIIEDYQNLIEEGTSIISNVESSKPVEVSLESNNVKEEGRMLLCQECKNPINKSDSNCEWCGCEF